MPDREKVISQIDADIQRAERTGEMLVCIGRKTAKDALALLKEQKAVKPTWGRGKPFCGVCGLRIRGGKFCSECGKPIAWEGR